MVSDQSAEMLRQSRAEKVAKIMAISGWLDPIIGDKQPKHTKAAKRILLDEERSASEWRTVLETMRQEILEAREAEAERNSSEKDGNSSPVNDEINKVKLVDKSYFLRKKFEIKDPAAKLLVTDTITLFSLNEAQERAFKIVLIRYLQ